MSSQSSLKETNEKILTICLFLKLNTERSLSNVQKRTVLLWAENDAEKVCM